MAAAPQCPGHGCWRQFPSCHNLARLEPIHRSIVERWNRCNEDMSMNEDRVVGTARNLGGQLEEGFGRATGDVKSQVEGKIKQATGAAQDLYGQARDVAGDAAKAVQQHAAPLEEALRNTIENRPYTAVAVALAIGWFIGRMSRMD
jgi:uncharacterized protein YjbJ (UPF0337 family)